MNESPLRLLSAILAVEKVLGEGRADAHPELVAALVIADALNGVADALRGVVPRVETSGLPVSRR